MDQDDPKLILQWPRHGKGSGGRGMEVGGGLRANEKHAYCLSSACSGPGWWEAYFAVLACASELLLAGLLLHGWCLLSSTGHQSLQRSGKASGRRAVVVPAVDFQAFSTCHCFKAFAGTGSGSCSITLLAQVSDPAPGWTMLVVEPSVPPCQIPLGALLC